MIKPTLITALLTTYVLYGCSSMEEKEDAPHFVGKKKAELIEAIGEPKYSIDSTFDDPRASRTLVYATTNPKLRCVESYKIDSHSQTVIDYACR